MKKIVRSCSCLLAILLLSSAARAQLVPPGLDNLLQHTLDSMRNATGAKSLSAAIQFSDGAVWAYADGISSVLPSADVTPDDAYLIGSVTKTITSACILQLAQEGELNLDDSLHQWLDTIPYINPNITIRQLLQHTSGLFDLLGHPHHQDSMLADITRVWTAEELVARFMAPPIFQPGTSWSYCNTNYFLLGMIIKKVTGNPFYTELRNRFFSPLGLNTVAIPSFEPLTSPVAHLWLDITGDNVLDDAHDFYMSYMALNSSAGAAGGYFATPADCSRWMRAYMRGDLLSPAMMAQARTTVSAPGSQGGLYGLGLMKNQSDFLGLEAYGHGGDLAYHASSWYFPARDASISVLTNDNNVTSWALIPVVRELLRTYRDYDVTAIDPKERQTPAVRVFPNPFDQEFTITFQPGYHLGNITAELYDVLGKRVAQHTAAAGTQNTVSLSVGSLGNLAGGIYFLRVTADGKRVQTVKLVK